MYFTYCHVHVMFGCVRPHWMRETSKTEYKLLVNLWVFDHLASSCLSHYPKNFCVEFRQISCTSVWENLIQGFKQQNRLWYWPQTLRIKFHVGPNNSSSTRSIIIPRHTWCVGRYRNAVCSCVHACMHPSGSNCFRSIKWKPLQLSSPNFLCRCSTSL